MLIINNFDIYNSKKLTKKTCSPIVCKDIAEVNEVQKKIQAKYQKKHEEEIFVLVHFTDTDRCNPKSDNLGMHNFTLKNWL